MRRNDNYVMMNRATPKRETLTDGRTFVARYKRVPRSRLPSHIKKKEGKKAHLWGKGVGG